MFNQCISSPVAPLTRTYVDTLARIDNEPDYSLISLATALVKPRVEDYSGITGKYHFTTSSEAAANRLEQFNSERNQENEHVIKNVPAFYYILTSMDEKDLNEIKGRARNIGLTELTVVENFVGQQLNNLCYGVFINVETNAAFVVVPSTSMALYHLSISFMSLLYPGLFKEHPLNKAETELLKSLTNKTSGNFIEKTSFILDYMKADLLRQELSRCFKGFRQGRIDRCRQEIDGATSRLEQIMRDYTAMMERYNELLVQFEGLQVVNSDDRNTEEQEAVEYMSTCPRIHDVTYQDGTLSFIADSLLTNFDVDKWQNAVRRNNIYDSYRIAEDSPFRDKSKRKLLLDNIFNNKPLLYIRMKGYVELQISLCNMTAPRGQIHAENYPELKNYISNPHFKIHGCPGRNREQIARCLHQADIVSAIECSIAAVGSVNIAETEYTFRPFLQEVLSSKNKILENNNGEAMTPEEALLWLSKQNVNNEEIMPF